MLTGTSIPPGADYFFVDPPPVFDLVLDLSLVCSSGVGSGESFENLRNLKTPGGREERWCARRGRGGGEGEGCKHTQAYTVALAHQFPGIHGFLG